MACSERARAKQPRVARPHSDWTHAGLMRAPPQHRDRVGAARRGTATGEGLRRTGPRGGGGGRRGEEACASGLPEGRAWARIRGSGGSWEKTESPRGEGRKPGAAAGRIMRGKRRIFEGSPDQVGMVQ